jgi:hypothetical protein
VALPASAVNRGSTTSYNGVAVVNTTHGAFTYDFEEKLYAVPFSLV